MEFAFATAEDAARIKEILEACGLEHRDIRPSQLKHFLVVRDTTALTLNGVVGLEPKDTVGLLRSLAVVDTHRRRGLATRLVDRIEAYARTQNVAALYLLTLTAEDFFTARGYHKTDRDSAPSTLQETTEFKSLCPQTATCMKKHL